MAHHKAVDKARKVAAEWELLRHEAWAIHGYCSTCRQLTHVRGKRKGHLKCERCFFA